MGGAPRPLDHLNEAAKGGAPDANEEILIYQTLLGVWPDSATTVAELADRMKQIRGESRARS